MAGLANLIVVRDPFKSLLSSLLYIAKCVKPVHFVLYEMLTLLRVIHLTDKYYWTNLCQDLAWFNRFLKNYNIFTHYDKEFVRTKVHFKGFGWSLEIPLVYN